MYYVSMFTRRRTKPAESDAADSGTASQTASQTAPPSEAARRELLKGNTPTLILAVLADEASHGYAIAREIERRSENALSLGEGSLYPALRALEADGFVQSVWETPATGASGGAGPARKTYHITDAGRGELARRLSTWRDFSRAVNAVVGPIAPNPA